MRLHHPVQPVVTLSEAQAFLRIDTGDQEATLAALIRSATEFCESFIQQVLVERPFSETVAPSADWQRLSATPVRTIDTVETIAADGSGTALAAADYAVDVDSSGDGWVRLTSASAAGSIRVSGSAGMAADGNGVPEPIRQGVLRLTAYLFEQRDGDASGVPAAVTALWRPYRRMRLA